jgi:hypothetical protein
MKDYAFADELADLYHQNNQPAEAENGCEAINMLSADEADSNEAMGPRRRLELAYASPLKPGVGQRPQTRQLNTTGVWTTSSE